MKQRLALPAPASQVATLTVFFQLSRVAANGTPTSDLAQVIFMAAAKVISAIPLEPSARIVGMDPAFAPPFRERLRRIYAKII